MPQKNFIGNKNLASAIFISIFIPYFVICVTLGGFHDSFFHASQCNQLRQCAPQDSKDDQGIILEDTSQHNSDTCQICQWFKMPSPPASFLSFDIHSGCIHASLISYSNPVLSLSPVHKFTIRPPPRFSSLFA